MFIRKATGVRIGALGAAAGAALILAACGSSSSGQTTKSTTAKPAAATAKGLTISTAKGSMGTYLVGPSGRALYLFLADHNGKSACSGSCAQNWPPLTTSSAPKAAGGANAGDFGSIVRTDGAKQVTYKGHPLYTFIGDTGPGMTTGQGSDAFGAKWWLVSPSGSALTGGSSSGSTTSSSSGGY